jgi:two-component system, NarL family, response regulator DevR
VLRAEADVVRKTDIRVLLVDDHAVAAAGFQAVLEHQPGICVIGLADTRDEALRRVAVERPDVVAVHADLAGVLEFCDEMRIAYPESRCLLYGSHVEERAIIDTVRSGARGFLLTSSPVSRIPGALRTVAAGESYLDPAVTQLLFQQLREPDAADPIAYLSTSERELLRHLSGGLSNREIAAKMYLSEKTVKNYVSRLLRKLDLERRTDALAYQSMFEERPRLVDALRPSPDRGR